MKKILTLLFWAAFWAAQAQIPPYYDDVDLSKRGEELKEELALKIINTHTTHLSYSELWDVLKQTDEVPQNNNKVYLIYGWENGTDDNCHNDIMRDKNKNGGSASACEWNREHVFPRSLGDPDLGSSGAGSDAHHVRACDVSMNGWRGNKKFIDASGVAGEVDDNYWYPGDEWKGDVARIIMYLYLRYGTQCLPRYVGEGEPVDTDPDMVDLFLEWNAEDPPSEVERQRNEILENLQGNRNPFIDNPYLATLIWGGPEATDTWNLDVSAEAQSENETVYPNPAQHFLILEADNEDVRFLLYAPDGKLVKRARGNRHRWNLEDLPAGVYWLIIKTPASQRLKKIVKISS